MENARVAIFEDNKLVQEGLSMWLEMSGHVVVKQVETFDAVNSTICGLAKSGEGVDIALVDGNLSRGEIDGTEGAYICDRLKSTFPAVRVVGMSMAGPVPGADTDILKSDTKAILDFIARI